MDYGAAVGAGLHVDRVGKPGSIQRRLQVGEGIYAPGQAVVGAGRAVVVVHDADGAFAAKLEDPAGASRVGRCIVILAVAVEVAGQPVGQQLAGELQDIVGHRLERHRGVQALAQPRFCLAVHYGQHIRLAVAVEVGAAVGCRRRHVRAEAAGELVEAQRAAGQPAAAQHDPTRVGLVAGCQVGQSVAVEVAGDQSGRVAAGQPAQRVADRVEVEGGSRGLGDVRFPERAVPGQQVGPAVAVEVGCQDLAGVAACDSAKVAGDSCEAERRTTGAGGAQELPRSAVPVADIVQSVAVEVTEQSRCVAAQRRGQVVRVFAEGQRHVVAVGVPQPPGR